jgi:hypothetical protein
MSVNHFNVRLKHKSYDFIQTDTGRWFDIANCYVLSDSVISGRDGLVSNTIPVPDSTVADLVAQASKQKTKGKGSRIRKRRHHHHQRKEVLDA